MLLLWRHHIPGCHSEYIFPDSCRKSSMSSNLIRGQRFNLHGSKCKNLFRFTPQVYTLSWSKLSDYFLRTHGRAHGRTEINHFMSFPDLSGAANNNRNEFPIWCFHVLFTTATDDLFLMQDRIRNFNLCVVVHAFHFSKHALIRHNHFIIKVVCLRRHRGSLWLKFTYIFNLTHCGPVLLYERGRHWLRQWLLACSVQGRLLDGVR